MTITEAKGKVRSIAKSCGYNGELSPESVDECAKVYIDNCGDDGTPRPRTYMRSGDGHKATALSEMQWLLTRTPSFRRWFGNSKVVDDNGDPQVMWHGSPAPIREFKPGFVKVQKSLMTLWSGPGFYFSDRSRVARIYARADGEIMPCFLRLENPLVVDETGNAESGCRGISKAAAVRVFMAGDNTQWLDVTLASILAREDHQHPREYYRHMKREDRVRKYVDLLKTDVVMLKTMSQAFGAKSQKRMFKAICDETGFDGVIHHIAPEVVEYVVYDPKAVKSANGNCGEFSRATAVVFDSENDQISAQPKDNATLSKGAVDMQMNGLISALNALGNKMAGNSPDAAADKAEAMDIIDRHGRHHQPKAIPEGGQYEEEGQYLTGQAKVDHAVRVAGEGKRGSAMREHVAPLFAGMGKDSITRAKLQKMHEDIRGLSKQALLRGMARNFKEMQRHAQNYGAVKDMGKEEFRAWLQQNPEYRTDMVDRLMNEGRYEGHHAVHGGFHDDGTGHQKHEAWEEAKWSVGAKAMASMIQFQEMSDAYHGTPDNILANEIESAQEDTPQVENNGGNLSDIDFEDAAHRFADHHHITFAPSHPVEMRNFLEQAQRGELDLTPPNQGISSNDMRYLGDITTALGPEHPLSRALVSAANRQRAGAGENAQTAAAENNTEPAGTGAVTREQANRIEAAVEYVSREASAEYPERRDGESEVDYVNRVTSYNYSHPDAVEILPEVNSIVQAARRGASQQEIGQRLADMVAHNYNWDTQYGEEVASAIISALTGVPRGDGPEGHGVRVESTTHTEPDGRVNFGNEDGVMAVNLPGLGRFLGRVDGESSVPETPSDATAGAGNASATPSGEHAAQPANQAHNPQLTANSYTDRDGNVRQIQHNEGGLKAQVHESELGAVQAEMRQAFADARNNVDGAEEYAHALSHFLGRGNDERSPHPGMRQEGILKHQLADKMVTRLEAKKNALEHANVGGSIEAINEATADLEATKAACKTIADMCGITADMLPEDHALRGVIGGNASEGQPQAQVQTSTASAGNSAATGAYTPTSREIESAAMALTREVGPMMTDMGLSRHNINEALAGRGDPLVLQAISNSIPHSSRLFQEIARANGFEPDSYGEGPTASPAATQPPRATNPEHQPLVDALHGITNPEPARPEDDPRIRSLVHTMTTSENYNGAPVRDLTDIVHSFENGSISQTQLDNYGAALADAYEAAGENGVADRVRSLMTNGGTRQSSQTNGTLPSSGIERARAMHQSDPISQTQIHDLATAYAESLGRNGTIVNPDLIENELGRLAQGQNYDDNAVGSGMSTNENYLDSIAGELGDSNPVLNELRNRYGMQGAQTRGNGGEGDPQPAAQTEAERNNRDDNGTGAGGNGTDPTAGVEEVNIDDVPSEAIVALEGDGGGYVADDGYYYFRRTRGGQIYRRPQNAQANGGVAAQPTAQTAQEPPQSTETAASVPGDGDVTSAASRLRAAFGMSMYDAERYVRNVINDARNGRVDPNHLSTAENMFGADHPITRFLRNAANGGAAAAAGQTQTNARTANAEPAQPRGNGQAATEQQTTNQTTGQTPAFGHTGSLPQNHPLRTATVNATMVRNRTQGMPNNITSSRQVTPQNLADIFGRLPVRGIFDHRNGDVRIPGVGRMNGFDALRQMVTDPSSAVGSEMRRRLSRANQNNPWVRRLNQAMDVLHPAQSAANGTASASSSGAASQAGSQRTATGFVPTETRAPNGDRRYSVPTEVMDADTATAGSKGFRRSATPVNYRGSNGGCNCYRNDAALLLQDRGFNVTARPAPSNNQYEFTKLKMAMADNYERVNAGSTRETTANLERMRTSYPNGTWVSMWSGGHNTSLRLKNGNWYLYSGWDGETDGRRVTSEQAASRINEPMRQVSDDDTTILYMAGFAGNTGYSRGINTMDQARNHARAYGVSEADFERFRSGRATPEEINTARSQNPALSDFMQGAKNFRAYKVMMKRQLIGRGVQHPTDEQVRAEMNREPLYYRANSSYVIKPTDKLIPELFDQVR